MICDTLGIESKLEEIIKDLTLVKAGSGEGFETMKDALLQRIDATDSRVKEVKDLGQKSYENSYCFIAFLGH